MSYSHDSTKQKNKLIPNPVYMFDITLLTPDPTFSNILILIFQIFYENF